MLADTGFRRGLPLYNANGGGLLRTETKRGCRDSRTSPRGYFSHNASMENMSHGLPVHELEAAHPPNESTGGFLFNTRPL